MRHLLYWFDAALSTVEPVITALFIKHINDFNETVTRISIWAESMKQVGSVFQESLKERDMAELQM